MKIVYIKLVNFVGVKAAMGLNEVSFDFSSVDKPIIQIYGKNRCGKTVLIQQLHPFSSINLNGDERSDLSLIIPKETGIKNIVYEVNGDVYNITHTYNPTRTNHTVSSSIKCNGEELNPSGGVNIFNSIVEKVLGINKYTFQFIINGTQLTSFGSMTATQRKNLMNKAMGIDIYDKMHKMATDDYRYTSKLIASLNSTKEFLLSTYGSYENLCTQLNYKNNECNDLDAQIGLTRSRIDSLSGQITTLRSQNVSNELIEVQNAVISYNNIVSEIGSFDSGMYDKLVDLQIELNNKINDVKSQRLLLLKDVDSLYEKKENIERTIIASKNIADDYNDMLNLRDDLTRKIESIVPKEYISSTSEYLKSMISMAQVINDTCTEIVICLNKNHLALFADMIDKNVDISGFLMQEGSALMDSEKEMSVVSRIRSMINSVDGEYPKECQYDECLYRKTYDTLNTYFKSYQSVRSSEFTQYDIEQFDHAYKNVQTIKRLLKNEIPDELKSLFDLSNIMNNLVAGEVGIPTSRLQFMMEEAAKAELKTQYISQLNDVEKSIENTKSLLLPTDNMDETINQINEKINEIKTKVSELDISLNELNSDLHDNDRKRMLLSQVQHVNINDLNTRLTKLTESKNQLLSAEDEYNRLMNEYNEMINRRNIILKDLRILQDAHTQYNTTVAEIEKHLTSDKTYKIIAEATSSTKGKPVFAIRDKVNDALIMTNRLLDVMYDGEIELLPPTIDETHFDLPFRCGGNISEDLKYGSQSESTLLSLALSLSLGLSLTTYTVALADELDAFLDGGMRDGFIMMLQEIMSVLKIEQSFIISHSIQPGQYDHVVHVVDISEIISMGQTDNK